MRSFYRNGAETQRETARLARRIFLLVGWIVSSAFGVAAVAQDVGDNAYNAYRLRAETWFDSEIEPRGDRDWYRLEITGNQPVRIETEGVGVDTYCILRNARQTVLVEDDDSGAGLHCRIDTQLAPGTYYLEIRGATYATVGRYRVRWSQGSSYSRTHGDTRTRAVRLRERHMVEGLFTGSSPREEHWYELTLSSDQSVTVEVRSRGTMTCSITDRQGKVLGTGSRSGLNVCLLQIPLARGDYRVLVKPQYGTSTDAYTVRWRSERIRDDHGDSRHSATRMRARTWVDGYLTSGDKDFFRIEPRSGRTTRVVTESASGTDTFCTLYDASGNRLATDGRGSGRDKCRLDFVGDGSHYFVEVKGARSSTAGEYRVRFDD